MAVLTPERTKTPADSGTECGASWHGMHYCGKLKRHSDLFHRCKNCEQEWRDND